MGLKHRLGLWLIPKLPVSRFAFDILRNEFNAAICRLQWKVLPHLILKRRRIRKLQGVYANLASAGFILPGFLQLDLFGGGPGVIRWDCTGPLPFGDGAVKGIRIEHFLEHVEPREHLPRFLADCFRALQPGGVLRIIVPDAEGFVRAYSSNSFEEFERLGWSQPFPDDLPTRMDVLNHIFHQWTEHRWGYDFETLAHRLKTAGFTNVIRQEFGFSLDPPLAQDREQHRLYSLYVEAVK